VQSLNGSFNFLAIDLPRKIPSPIRTEIPTPKGISLPKGLAAGFIPEFEIPFDRYSLFKLKRMAIVVTAKTMTSAGKMNLFIPQIY
jgi:hypothetical protein